MPVFDPLRTLVCLLGSWGELLYQVQIPRRPGNSQFSGSADRVPADLASRFSTGFAAAVCAKAVVTGLVDLGVPRFDFPLDWLRLLEGLRHRRYAQARSSSQTRRYITPNVRFPPASATTNPLRTLTVTFKISRNRSAHGVLQSGRRSRQAFRASCPWR